MYFIIRCWNKLKSIVWANLKNDICALTWVRHMKPGGVRHSIHVDVGPGWEAVLIGLWWKDVKDGQQEADQPATAHPE